MVNSEINISTLKREAYEQYFKSAIPYSDYLKRMELEAKGDLQAFHAEFIPLNFQRSKRIGKTVILQDGILDLLSTLNHKINWLVITELWCGDSSQILPVINAIAEASKGKIDLRIVYRDENDDLMSAHLSNGNRAIPKLIQLDTKFHVTGVWGPSPNEARELVLKLKADPLTAPTYSEKLHKWYADDKTMSTQRDLLKLLKIGSAFCLDCISN